VPGRVPQRNVQVPSPHTVSPARLDLCMACRKAARLYTQSRRRQTVPSAIRSSANRGRLVTYLAIRVSYAFSMAGERPLPATVSRSPPTAIAWSHQLLAFPSNDAKTLSQAKGPRIGAGRPRVPSF
jgi:hypothetical protein